MTTSVTGARWHLPVLAICIAAFAICTSELIIAGLLPGIAADLGVDIPTSGLLVTFYAIGVGVLGPLLTPVATRLPRRSVLIGLLGIFVAGSLLCAVAPGYWLLMAARLVTAACHGLFFGVAMVLAMAVAPAERKATAVAMVSAGVASAVVAGVPVGTAIGNALGWRASFMALAALGVVVMFVLAALIPNVSATQTSRESVSSGLAAMRRPTVLLGYGIIATTIIGMLALLTYIVPMLTDFSGISLSVVPVVIAIMGIMGFVGSFVGGRLGDWNAVATLIAVFAINTILFALLALLGANGWLAAIILALSWFVAFLFQAPIQSRILKDAAAAPTLASTLISTAFQIGIASGAVIGGAAIRAGLGYISMPVLAATFNGLALLLALTLAWVDRTGESKP